MLPTGEKKGYHKHFIVVSETLGPQEIIGASLELIISNNIKDSVAILC